MRDKNMENFYTSIEPLCTFLRFLGFLPRNFINPACKGQLKKTRFSIIQTGFGVGLLLLLSIGNMVHYFVYEVYKMDLLIYSIWSWILFFANLSFTIECIYQLYKADSITTFFKLMQTIDLKILQMEVSIDHRVHRKIVSNVILITVLLMFARIPLIVIFYGYVFEFYTRQVLISEVFYNFLLIYECLFCLQFIIPTYLLRERFKLLKDILRFIFLERKTFNLNLFTEIFHDLSDALDTINSLFTSHLFPTILLMLLIDIFGIYGVTKFSFTTAKFTDIFLSLFYIIVHFILKIMICHIGYSTTNEAENIKITFVKGMNKINLSSEESSLVFVYNQIEARDLRLQNIFFVVDWKMLFGTTYTIVTFLVITCQFQSPLR
ncbi:hypothetical protein ACKWTF_004558 [Chironomus riparius]